MSDPVIYFAPGSCSIAAMCALEHCELAYDAVLVPMSPDGAGDEAFISLNPRRQVPVLVLDGDVVRETPAILAALDARHPEAGLLPPAGRQRILALEWLSHLGGTIHPAFRPLFRPHRFVGDDEDAGAILHARTLEMVGALFAQLERDLGSREWLLSNLTSADFYLFVFGRWMKHFGAPLGRAVLDHHERVAALPPMQRALARERARAPGGR